MGTKRTIYTIFLFGLAVGLLGCQSRPIDEQEARSKIKSILSLSAETRMFIHQIRNEKVTEPFTASHINYLKQLQSDLSHDVRRPVDPKTMDTMSVAQEQITRLAGVLTVLTNSRQDDAELQAQEIYLDDINAKLKNLLAP